MCPTIKIIQEENDSLDFSRDIEQSNELLESLD